MENLIIWIVQFVIAHQYFVPFISGIMAEEVLIITTLLSGKGTIPIYAIFIFGFLGIVISDIFWFSIIKLKPLMRFSKKVGKIREKALKKTKIHDIPPPTSLLSYILSKFTFGLRSWAIFYCSVHGMTLKRFIRNTSIATAIWLIVMIPLARIAGKSILTYFQVSESLGKIILLVVLFIIIWTLITKVIFSKIHKRIKKS